MFTLALKRYFAVAVIFLLLTIISLESDVLGIFIVNCILLFSNYYLLRQAVSAPDSQLTSEKLIGTIFIYAIAIVALFKCVSYLYTGNFFVFSEADASVYHYESLAMASLPFFESISTFTENWSTEDLGAVLVISSIYRVLESQLLLAFFYILVGTRTALGLFRISCHIMPRRYAYFAALSFGISSFVLWFHSSGLKESFLVMVVVLVYECYYSYLKRRKLSPLICGIFLLSSLMLFRPAILFFIVFSIGFGSLLARKLNVRSLTLIFIAGIIIVVFSTYILSTADRFLLGGIDEMHSAKESTGMIKGGLVFTYIVNILGSALGPFPTFSPNNKILLSFFSTGLVLKVLLSFYFWVGLFRAIRCKFSPIYAILIFVIFESGSLIFILEALELRKSLPHFPFIYVVAFWGISQIESMKLTKFSEFRKISSWSRMFLYVSILIIFYWNLR